MELMYFVKNVFKIASFFVRSENLCSLGEFIISEINIDAIS